MEYKMTSSRTLLRILSHHIINIDQIHFSYTDTNQTQKLQHFATVSFFFSDMNHEHYECPDLMLPPLVSITSDATIRIELQPRLSHLPTELGVISLEFRRSLREANNDRIHGTCNSAHQNTRQH